MGDQQQKTEQVMIQSWTQLGAFLDALVVGRVERMSMPTDAIFGEGSPHLDVILARVDASDFTVRVEFGPIALGDDDAPAAVAGLTLSGTLMFANAENAPEAMKAMILSRVILKNLPENAAAKPTDADA